jgi:hypothetical protein
MKFLSRIIDFFIVSNVLLSCVACQYIPQCRDPDLGGEIMPLVHETVTTSNTSAISLKQDEYQDSRKYLLVGFPGGGVGNTLIFFPAAYYFAMLSSRIILIDDTAGSLISEICTVLHCGYPLYSEVADAFPALFTEKQKKIMKGVKASEFNQYINGQIALDQMLLHAHGHAFQSGWYFQRDFAEKCVVSQTGCFNEDVDCHDRSRFGLELILGLGMVIKIRSYREN